MKKDNITVQFIAESVEISSIKEHFLDVEINVGSSNGSCVRLQTTFTVLFTIPADSTLFTPKNKQEYHKYPIQGDVRRNMSRNLLF